MAILFQFLPLDIDVLGGSLTFGELITFFPEKKKKKVSLQTARHPIPGVIRHTRGVLENPCLLQLGGGQRWRSTEQLPSDWQQRQKEAEQQPDATYLNNKMNPLYPFLLKLGRVEEGNDCFVSLSVGCV